MKRPYLYPYPYILNRKRLRTAAPAARFRPLLLIFALACMPALSCAQESDSQAKTKTKAVTSAPVPAQPAAATAPPPQARPHPEAASRQFVDSLMKNFRVEPCCGGTLEACAAQKPNCAIAARLASFTVWMDSLGTVPGDRMAEALQNRYETFADSRKFSSDLKGWPVVGDPNAPTTMVSYYSVTCPLCKSSFVELYTAVTSGPLKGRVKIVPKPFGAGTANIAAVAAHEMGRFAEFMIALGQENARIDENVIYKIADNMGLDRGKFKSLIEDPRLLKRAEQSVEEGRTNGVTHVPTYFIDGRRYESVINTRWIIEAIDFIQETAAKKK